MWAGSELTQRLRACRGDDDEGEDEAADEQEEGTSDSEEQRQRMREEVLALSRRHSGELCMAHVHNQTRQQANYECVSRL